MGVGPFKYPNMGVGPFKYSNMGVGPFKYPNMGVGPFKPQTSTLLSHLDTDLNHSLT